MYTHCFFIYKMFGKYFFLLLVVTVVVQSHVPHSLEEKLEEAQLGGILDSLDSLVKDAIAKAKASLSNIKEELSKQVKSIVEEAKQALNNEYTELLEELNQLKQQAKALGIDILDCLKSNEQRLKDLPKVYSQRIIQCGEDKWNAGKMIIETAKASVEDSIQIVNDLTKKFNQCGSGFSGAWCKTTVTAEITKAVAEVPVNILKTATDVIPYVNSLYPDLQKCTLNVSKDFLSAGNQIIDDIEACIQSKIKPENSTVSFLN